MKAFEVRGYNSHDFCQTSHSPSFLVLREGRFKAQCMGVMYVFSCIIKFQDEHLPCNKRSRQTGKLTICDKYRFVTIIATSNNEIIHDTTSKNNVTSR
jgi:hypothetical protein